MLTGSRVGEVRQTRFEQFNLERGSWSKPTARTKQRKIHRIPITAEAAAIVRQRQLLVPKGNPWLLPGDVPGSPSRKSAGSESTSRRTPSCPLAQDSVVAEHLDNDQAPRECIHLVCHASLIGSAVFRQGRTCGVPFRTARHATGQPEHCDQRGGGSRHRASDVGLHRFSPMLKGARPSVQRVPRFDECSEETGRR